MPRILPNWITSFRDWTVPRSEAQESLILWSGLWTLACVMKRKVSFPRSILGSYDIYPNLYIIFVGPPGIVRKSTTAGYAETLLIDTQLANVSSTAMSVSKMVEIMANKTDGSIAILSSEFASFMNISKDEMYDALTDMYDNKAKYEYATRSYDYEIIEAPSINMLACTTPEWISNYMPVSAIGGGFASRVLFIYENRVRRRQMYYDIDQKKVDDLGSALQQDLLHISELEGEFSHDSPETKQEIEDWYNETADLPASDERIAGYLNRKHVHIHKVAMLLALAEGDKLIITMTHFNAARALLDQLEINMPRVFTGIGKNPFSADMEGIRDFIASTGDWVPRPKLIRRFAHNLQSTQMDEILMTLISCGFIEKAKTDIGGKKVMIFRTVD